jgi:glycosyltransferase involved in cell wall biosynthesis
VKRFSNLPVKTLYANGKFPSQPFADAQQYPGRIVSAWDAVATVNLSKLEGQHRTKSMDQTNSADDSEISILYHYFSPDDVVSAIHFGELAEGLVRCGWKVNAFPTVWGCRDDSRRFSSRETWHGVTIKRIWRPRFRQASSSGRILNAIWMIVSWSLLALRRDCSPDVLLIGTDPIFSLLVARFWKFVKPQTRIVHWCFDLYPEAAIVDGLIREDGTVAKLSKHLLRPAYAACSMVADLGPCMARRLREYPCTNRLETLVPWALDEQENVMDPDLIERGRIFGAARLAVLYSGSFGRAHGYDEILDLATLLMPEDVRFAFSIRGNLESELRDAVKRRSLVIPFVPFAKASELPSRLACADVHVVALRPEWTGTVVPSKFFGALSAGRPVLFSGSSDSSIAQWIRDYKVGWVLNSSNIAAVATELLQYADSPQEQKAMREHCFAVYRQCFSRDVQIERWNERLRSLLSNATSEFSE